MNIHDKFIKRLNIWVNLMNALNGLMKPNNIDNKMYIDTIYNNDGFIKVSFYKLNKEIILDYGNINKVIPIINNGISNLCIKIKKIKNH